jgi:hypothetical protein
VLDTVEDLAGLPDQPGQPRLALAPRQRLQILAIEPQQIEDMLDDVRHGLAELH